MARFLALDWDHNQIHLAAADVRNGTVRLQRAIVWREALSPNPAEVEGLGRLLRERLKEAGIAAAPVLACIGRERVILKDIRHPVVPAHEEPAIVRFQAMKELTDPPDEVVIDYAPAGEAQGERRALTLVARRELVHAYRDLCQAAGLKLAALTPRPFGIVACLKPPPAEAGASDAVAVLAVAERWAEFCVARGDTVVFARSLAVGPTLPGEVRRSLAVYNGQAPQSPVRTVYVAGGEEHAPFRESLQNLLNIPVHSFDPVAGAERVDVPEGTRGAFAGAVGLLHAQAVRGQQPINFVQPKQPKPPRDVNRQRVLVGALAAALLVAGLLAFGYWRLTVKDREVVQLGLRLSTLEQRERSLQPDVKSHTDLQKWTGAEIKWHNEMYELSALWPDTERIQVKQFVGSEYSSNSKEKEYIARMTITGIMPRDNTGRALADELRRKLYQEGYYRPGPVEPTSSRSRGGRTQEFKLTVDAKGRPAAEYNREIDLAAEQAKAKGGPFKGGKPGFGFKKGGQP